MHGAQLQPHPAALCMPLRAPPHTPPCTPSAAPEPRALEHHPPFLPRLPQPLVLSSGTLSFGTGLKLGLEEVTWSGLGLRLGLGLRFGLGLC